MTLASLGRACAVVVLAVTSACTTAEPGLGPSLREAHGREMTAIRESNLELFADAFSEEAVIVSPGMT